MVRIPSKPTTNVRAREKAYSDGYDACVVCRQAVNIEKPHWALWVHRGGDVAVTEAEGRALNAAGHEAADCGYHTVGPDCLRRHPELKPYAVRNHMSEPDGLVTVPGFGTSSY